MKMFSATMSAIVLGLLPVAASPLMGQYLGTDGAYREMEAVVDPENPPTPEPPMPICDCPENPTMYNYSKQFADTYSQACEQLDPTKKYRWGVWLSEKYVCRNGHYWICRVDELRSCHAPQTRPTCPQDTCAGRL